MNITDTYILIASIVTCFLLQAQGADKYTDGNRPYEFGFSIDGEQHRHEKKDEKGLIEGEFGFITADGVYHVTVYATDEQGRFKILSMKNIRVKPYPTYTAKQSSTSARQGHSLELPASVQSTVPPLAVTTTTLKPISLEPPINSCSHCSIPTTSTPAPIVPQFNQIGNNQIGTTGNPKIPQGVKPQSAFFNQPIGVNLQQSFSGTPQGISPNYPAPPQNTLQTPFKQGPAPQQNSQNFPQQGSGLSPNSPTGLNSPQAPESPPFPQQQFQTPQFPNGPSSYPGSTTGQNSPDPNSINTPRSRAPKRLDGAPVISSVDTPPNSFQRGLQNNQDVSTLPKKPTLISAQMQIVDKNTDIYRRGPGENEGLPEGLTKDDMTKLLYTFNYTVGFHGHFEEGYVNGAKQGYYFITGRNGVRTRVDYVADSKGFHPKISQEVLDLLSDDVPKPETEKEEKYGLKGYEFKWLYYPIESKGR